MGFDYARTENEAERIGSATGIVNVGGFVASLLTIALIGIVLSLRSSGGPSSYTLDDFRLAFSVQYVFWGSGWSACCTTAAGCAPPAAWSSTRSRGPSCGCGGTGAIRRARVDCRASLR